MSTVRLGVIGAGQVWKRLYQPAMAMAGQFTVAGIADPVRGDGTGPWFDSADALLDSGGLDAVAVLSPPALHAAHVLQCIERGLAVLVEKPPALSAAELAAWEAAGGSELVTPALSRRYWRRYADAGLGGRRWEFRLTTNPGDWGAQHPEPVSRDLLPHAVDLARWLSGEEVGAVRVFANSSGRAAGEFTMDRGGTVAWEVAHGPDYAEALSLDRRAVADAAGFGARIARRLGRGAPQDVEGVAAMLADWATALGGERPAKLPSFTDAKANVEAIEQVLTATLEDA